MRIPSSATAALLLLTCALTACVSTSGPDAADLAAVKASRSTIVLLRVVTTSNAGPVPPFDDALESQCISVGLGGAGDDSRVEQIDGLESFSEESLAAGWLYLVLPPGKHVVAFNPPTMWDARSDAERWAETPNWQFLIPVDTPVAYIGTMQLHCRAEASDFGGIRLRDIRAQKLHDESAAAAALVAQYLPGLPPPRSLTMKRLYARESDILNAPR